MNILIAEYFTDEINGWINTVDFHLEESEGIDERLNQILHYNTVPKLAATVEHNLTELQIGKQSLMSLKNEIRKQEATFYSENKLIENGKITETQRELQKKLRDNLRLAEKQFLDIRYSCDEFITETVCSQNIQ